MRKPEVIEALVGSAGKVSWMSGAETSRKRQRRVTGTDVEVDRKEIKILRESDILAEVVK